MKKTFPLLVADRAKPRVIDAIKHEVRKYLKRERRKALPEGADFWAFECRVGQGEAPPEPKHVAELIPAIDAVAGEDCATVYVEILAVPGRRQPKPTA